MNVPSRTKQLLRGFSSDYESFSKPTTLCTIHILYCLLVPNYGLSITKTVLTTAIRESHARIFSTPRVTLVQCARGQGAPENLVPSRPEPVGPSSLIREPSQLDSQFAPLFLIRQR